MKRSSDTSDGFLSQSHSASDEELEAFEPRVETQTQQPVYTFVAPQVMNPMGTVMVPPTFTTGGGVQLFPVHPMMQTNVQQGVDPLATLAPVYTGTMRTQTY